MKSIGGGNIMKKLISCIVTLMLLFSTTACNKTALNEPKPTQPPQGMGPNTGTNQNANSGVNTGKTSGLTPNTGTNQGGNGIDNNIGNNNNGNTNITGGTNNTLKGKLNPIPNQNTGQGQNNSRDNQIPNVGLRQGRTSGFLAASYKDGTYTGISNKTKNGYSWAKVTINKGKINGITLRRFDANGKEVSYSSSLNQDRRYIMSNLLQRQNINFGLNSENQTQVNDWKTAITRALDKGKLTNNK